MYLQGRSWGRGRKEGRGGSAAWSRAPLALSPCPGIWGLSPEKTTWNGLESFWKASGVTEVLVVLRPAGPHFIEPPLAVPGSISAKPGLDHKAVKACNNGGIQRLTKAARKSSGLLCIQE